MKGRGMYPMMKELKTANPGLGPCIKFGRRSLPLSRPRLGHNVDTVGNRMGSNMSVKVSSGDEENLPLPIPGKKLRDYTEMAYMTGRAKVVNDYFPTAIGIDDFLHRLEIALYAYGFSGDNAIAMVNLCRDEITVSLKNKIDQVFGSSFNTNGLGGVLTCGVTGVAAGLSHAPVSKGSGKERYVFFSFPHISIDSKGEVGTISRPGRPGLSCACGALNQALVDIKAQGVSSNCKIPGVHEPLDPEFTILKQRLARRLRYDGIDDDGMAEMDLVELTRIAERTISDDLDYLISHTVDPKKADYAVVTGIQVHNWGTRFDDESPNLEFVAPVSVYVVVNGTKEHIDLNTMPSLTPRQIRILAESRDSSGSQAAVAEDVACNSTGFSTLREIDPPYLYRSRRERRQKKEQAETYASLIQEEGLSPDTACPWPSWQTSLRQDAPAEEEGNSAFHFDSKFTSGEELDEMWTKLQMKYVSAGPRGKKNESDTEKDDDSQSSS
eukprot:jgi/Picsp_1/6086/NSC_03440-R1_low-co2 inducible protein